jgi:hypothetical protein
VDWSVIVAGVAAGFAGLTAWNSRHSAQASRQSAAASRDALERAHRPVLVPVRPEIEPRPRSVRIDVRNIGMGPALNVTGTMAATVASDPWGIGRAVGTSQIAKGDSAVVTFEATSGQLEVAMWHVRLTYEDAAGEPHWSAFHYETRRPPRVAVGRGPLPDDYVLPERSSWQEPPAGDRQSP